MCFSESKSTLPFNTIRPSSGVSISGDTLERHGLPLPEAPRMPMTPPSVLSDTSSEKPENLFLIAACRLIAHLPSVHSLPRPQTVPPNSCILTARFHTVIFLFMIAASTHIPPRQHIHQHDDQEGNHHDDPHILVCHRHFSGCHL